MATINEHLLALDKRIGSEFEFYVMKATNSADLQKIQKDFTSALATIGTDTFHKAILDEINDEAFTNSVRQKLADAMARFTKHIQ